LQKLDRIPNDERKFRENVILYKIHSNEGKIIVKGDCHRGLENIRQESCGQKGWWEFFRKKLKNYK